LDDWVGKGDDEKPPPRVRLRVFQKYHGRCYRCTKKILPGEFWECDHVKALINGGSNSEDNLAPLCCNCVAPKNAEDVAEKSDVAEKAKKHFLPKKPSRFPGGRGSKFKRTMSGKTVRR
jgi:5-methylcytosine-specific restriction endonuclease McrA